MLPLAGLLVGLGPRQPEDVGEEALGQAVAAHDPLGQPHARRGEPDGRAGELDQLGRLHPLDHLGHGRARHIEPLGDAGLDDVDVVLPQLEDRLAVLLEGGMPLGGLVLGHGRESTRAALSHLPLIVVTVSERRGVSSGSFSPPVRAWFDTTFAAPTEAQRQGWPAIAAGDHTLSSPRPVRARPSPRSCGASTG